MARASRKTDPFDALSFHLGRAYYDHLQVIERLIAERDLNQYLASGMGQILFKLFAVESCLIKDLVATLRLAPSRLTAVLGRMEKAGLIERRSDPDDKRAVRVKLTPFGRSLENDCRAVLNGVNDILTAGMTQKQIKDCKNALITMVENLDDYQHQCTEKANTKKGNTR